LNYDKRHTNITEFNRTWQTVERSARLDPGMCINQPRWASVSQLWAQF